MKKIIALILLLLFPAVFLFGCKSQSVLYEHTTELRRDIFKGENKDITVVAHCGFKEKPFINNGKCEKIYHYIDFKLLNKEMENATYNISFNVDGKTYTDNFSFSPTTNALNVSFLTDEFNKKEFDITISVGSDKYDIKMKSIVPQDTISYTSALNYLEKNHKDLIGYFSDNEGNFNGEIHGRIIVKNEKPYWYIGLIKDTNCQKALLVDGINGNVLAIRELY